MLLRQDVGSQGISSAPGDRTCSKYIQLQLLKDRIKELELQLGEFRIL